MSKPRLLVFLVRPNCTPASAYLGRGGVKAETELGNFGEQIGIHLDARVESGGKTENTILSEADRGGFDLLVMGVMLRPSERRLYFGPKVEHVLRNARCAFAVVVTPEITSPRAA